MLHEILQYYYDSRRCLYGAATNHTDASRFDKSGVNLSSRGVKIVNVRLGLEELKKRRLYVRQILVAQKA